MDKRRFGQAFENVARDFLLAHGPMQCLVQNYQTPLGEIDLIMQHHQARVFVEVRYREDGSAAFTVSRAKQRRVIRVAQQYLVQENLYDKIDCRFDVVAIAGNAAAPHIEWLKNAFEQ
jgi:putative endonuclease